MLIFRSVIQLPFVNVALPVDVGVIAVYSLTVVGAKQIILALEQRLLTVFGIKGIIAAKGHAERSGVS